MNKGGPIIIIEDDLDDQEMFTEAFASIGVANEIIFFNDGELALAFLEETEIEPFIIFSDINMPKLNGMELRNKIHENEKLRIMSIPYLFFSTSAEQARVVDAYSKSIQGFFVKPNSITKLEFTLKAIIQYWTECVSPNYVK